MYCVCLFLIYAFKKQFASLCTKKSKKIFKSLYYTAQEPDGSGQG